MAKRFIDTELFDDPWFMDLSLSAKVLWVYCITKCNHAGIIEINARLAQLQTGIKSIETVIKELDNRLISVRDKYYFIPKYIDFQYPGFPNSKVRQQISAIDILRKFNLFDEEKQTVSKGLTNSYDNESDNDNESVINISFEDFWNLYNKKVGSKENCIKKWINLKDEERQKIIDTLPGFISSIKDKQFQPYPETYLNKRRWEDEVIKRKETIYDKMGPI